MDRAAPHAASTTGPFTRDPATALSVGVSDQITAANPIHGRAMIAALATNRPIAACRTFDDEIFRAASTIAKRARGCAAQRKMENGSIVPQSWAPRTRTHITQEATMSAENPVAAVDIASDFLSVNSMSQPAVPTEPAGPAVVVLSGRI